MRVIKPIIILSLFSLHAIFALGQNNPVPRNLKDTFSIRIDSLKPAIVTAALRPHMRGDTLVYNTEHIKMRRNAVVEDLLRRLPGLQVDQDGTITYNGEKIQHLLVDGRDIFGDQPTLVTRNFDASKIARVEILDRKSDQAVFTGMDNGTRTKTLNLVVKETAKNGYFGKIGAAGDAEGYYTASGSLAGFKGNEQLTVLASASNTGETPSSMGAGSDPLGASAGQGIPKSVATELHYGNTWASQDNFSGNYQYGHLSTEPFTTTRILQTQADSIYGQTQQNRSANQYDHHAYDIVYDHQFTPKTAFRFDLQGDETSGQNQFWSDGNSTFNDTLVNSYQRNIHDKISGEDINGTMGWRTQIGNRPTSVISVFGSIGKSDNATHGYLYSLNQFYEPSGNLQSVDTIDQYKVISSHSTNISGSVGYTFPLWSNNVIGVRYGYAYSGGNPLSTTYGRGDGKYSTVIDSLSSDLETRTLSHQGLLNLEGKSGHFSYSFGLNWLDYFYRHLDRIADTVINLHYVNFSPTALLNFTPKPGLNFKVNYTASTQEPSPAQLMSIKNNADPLHITIGNPNLRPSFNQNIEWGFRCLKAWNIGLNGNFNFANNSISTTITTDSLGRQVSRPVNVNGAKAAAVNLGANHEFLGINWGAHFDNTFYETFNYINESLNRNDASTTGMGFVISKYVPDKYDFYIRTNFSYFNSRNSINLITPLHYWTQNYSVSAAYYGYRKYEVNTDVNYTWQEKTANLANNIIVTMWNASVARNFFDNDLSVKFLVKNLLNAEAMISRTNSGNINTQTTTNVLGRYWMIAVSYHFDRSFKKK